MSRTTVLPQLSYTDVYTTNTITHRRYAFLYFFMAWISGLPIAAIAVWFFSRKHLWDQFPDLWTLFITPIIIIVLWMLWIMCAILTARIFLVFVKLMHKPREGIFDANPKDKDYKYWAFRGTIRKFGIWASHTFPLPWLDIFAFRILGVKQKGGGTAYFDCWVDTEFLEVGNNTLFGLGAVIMTSMIVGDKLIILSTKIGDNTLIGAMALVAPGTQIGDNVVLGSDCTTEIGQELKSEWVYTGVPAREFKKNELSRELEYKRTDVVERALTEEDVKQWYGMSHLRKKRKETKEKKEMEGIDEGEKKRKRTLHRPRRKKTTEDFREEDVGESEVSKPTKNVSKTENPNERESQTGEKSVE